MVWDMALSVECKPSSVRDALVDLINTHSVGDYDKSSVKKRDESYFIVNGGDEYVCMLFNHDTVKVTDRNHGTNSFSIRKPTMATDLRNCAKWFCSQYYGKNVPDVTIDTYIQHVYTLKTWTPLLWETMSRLIDIVDHHVATKPLCGQAGS